MQAVFTWNKKRHEQGNSTQREHYIAFMRRKQREFSQGKEENRKRGTRKANFFAQHRRCGGVRSLNKRRGLEKR
jgi:hypothetical protein